MSHIQSQCWICKQCHDDKHHTPGGVQCLKQQIQNLTLANRDLQLWFDDARAESEALRGRVAELESWIAIRPHISERDLELEYVKWVGASCMANKSQAWLLRKQAEAVDVTASTFIGRDFVDIKFMILEQAQKLRQQATDAEKAGGEGDAS